MNRRIHTHARRHACRRVSLAVCLLALAAPAAASAESDRDMMLELKFGPYRPAVDSEFGSATPYEDIFGSGSMFMTKLELDYEFFKMHGTLGVGGTIGYAQDTGRGVMADGTTSSDETTLHVLPLSIDLVYRWDWLAHNHKVPLVPVVKAGFDYYVWWVTNGVGRVPQWEDPVTGKVSQGRGGTFGGHVTFGLSLMLDFLAPDMAQTFDTDVGVNNTFLFAEFTMSWIDDFGARSRMDFSSNSFLAGIAFEF
ncbi:MAG: hypothetical protein FJ087_14650 [Deltaproteobacteria bacterium]|nr:hypothetical protein [Deltaproteobacteria bacterium]